MSTRIETPARTGAGDGADMVVLRRNAWLSGAVAVVAALLGVGYLARGSGVLDLAVGAILLLLAALHAAGLASLRTPVLVADEHGIRMRVGATWRGLPWGSVRQVVVEHADNPLRESRLVVVPRDARSSLDHLGALGRLHLRWNRLWYGAALSVPLGMTTLTESTDLGGDLGALAAGRTDVVQLRGRNLAQLDDVVGPGRVETPDAAETDPAGSAETRAAPDVDAVDVVDAHAAVAADAPIPFADLIAGNTREGVYDHLATEPEDNPDSAEDSADALGEDTSEVVLPAPVAPVRPLSLPARVEVRLDAPAISGRAVPDETPEELAADHPTDDTTDDAAEQQAWLVPVQRRSDGVEAPDLVHAEAWEEVPVEIESEDLTVHAPEPVIGPKIAHAREMLYMSIEELSQRTRIRPHVLEAIEVDDFGPCGGDFYARGHLTSIARVLGLTLEPLMKEYDERYAGGPINARRVFEAELATGLSSGMRATRGGPQWTLLIVAVLALTMVWGVARLLSGDPAQVTAPPSASSDSAGLAANRQPITSPLMKTTPMTVTAAHAGAHVVVRDRTGRILWSGDLRMTHHRKVVGLAPFRVESDNAGAIEVTVAGRALGTIGTPGQAGSKRFG